MPQSTPLPKVARALCLLVLLVFCVERIAANERLTRNDQSSSDRNRATAVVWDLDDRTGMKSVGKVRSIAGPRSPEFPYFGDGNQGVLLRGRERLEIASNPSLTFELGDAITVEAWISPQRVGDSSPRYVVGKGRTGQKGYPKDNQNWALRITPKEGSYRLSFLFATNHEGVNRYHRWTTVDSTIAAGDGWHHVAVGYQFGHPDSMVGWIDGRRVEGVWDMAGKTSAGPVTDDAAVWIGSAQNGNRSNSFVGAIDRVAVTRRILSDEVIRAQSRRDPAIPRPNYDSPPSMPDFGDLRRTVLFEMREDLPAADRWPNQLDLQLSEPVFAWTGDSFLLPRLPAHFDDWGIRSAYRPNVYLTIASELELPTGPNRFLLRCRSLGRLWIDGEIVAETPARLKNAPSGE
ncbi:MAG: LamG-like jellyroll fold domain-containing protein, partial [Planctomycetota bacterium]